MSTDQLSEADLLFTRRALELAAKGIGLVSPNPLVGCVIVTTDGEMAGEGFYTYDGVIHAEAIALAQAGERARGATAYVSLEPHSHHGKTPPCTQALIDAGIARVVCPIEDPNPLVSGRGFDALREAGVEVIIGPLAAEAARLNEQFIVWHQKNRPFVHLKLAMSLDGRISLGKSVSTAISGTAASEHVHGLRHMHDAILIGGSTACTDDPVLTDRSGKERRRPLSRIVLDNRLRMQPTSRLAATADQFPTVIFSNSTDDEAIATLTNHAVRVMISADGGRDIELVLETLRQLEIQSVLVEGGTEVAGAFCDAGLVDKVTLIAAPFIIGGPDAPHAIGGKGADSLESVLRLKDIEVTRLDDDIVVTGYPIMR